MFSNQRLYKLHIYIYYTLVNLRVYDCSLLNYVYHSISIISLFYYLTMHTQVAINAAILIGTLCHTHTYAFQKGKAIATYYTGNVGAGGVWLNKYPSKRVYIHNIHRSKRLYPVAVYSDRVRKLKYSVIKLKKGHRKIFAHVVDECASGDCHVNRWIAKKRGAVLFDLHRTTWRAMHFKSPTIVKNIRYTIVGKATRKNKSIFPLLTKDGRQGYVPKKWK